MLLVPLFYARIHERNISARKYGSLKNFPEDIFSGKHMELKGELIIPGGESGKSSISSDLPSEFGLCQRQFAFDGGCPIVQCQDGFDVGVNILRAEMADHPAGGIFCRGGFILFLPRPVFTLDPRIFPRVAQTAGGLAHPAAPGFRSQPGAEAFLGDTQPDI
jgi:hypothetical protein